MQTITISYSLSTENDKPFINLKITDTQWPGGKLAALFGEISESLLHSSYDNVCIDLSSLDLVSSGVFGSCVNIVDTARDQGKHVKFRLNADAMETARLASFDKLTEIEQV